MAKRFLLSSALLVVFGLRLTESSAIAPHSQPAGPYHAFVAMLAYDPLPTPTRVPTLFVFPTAVPTVYRAPTATPIPSGVRTGAICNDGTSSTATGSGACSHHGGVAYWLY